MRENGAWCSVFFSSVCSVSKKVNISVIIPTWNRLHVLKRAIDSVLAQTFTPVEVIVIDDGSSDGTAEWIKQNYPSIILVVQKQSGVSAARNAGIRRAKGEWIALLDSDDEWLPQKLARQMDLLSFKTDALVCHTDEIWVRNGKRVNAMNKHQKPEGYIYQHCLPLCCVSPSSILIHKSVFDDAGVFDESYPACEDYELWLRIFCRYEAALVREPLLIKYGGHDDQLSRIHWGMDRFRVRAIDGVLENQALNDDDRRQSIKVLKKKCEILCQGAEKRQKYEDADAYRTLSEKYNMEEPSC